MAQLVNPSINPGESKSFNPNVDNTARTATASGGGKAALYISFIFILPIIWYIVVRNGLIRNQTSVNELASGIDVQLKKRRDTLLKLSDVAVSYMKYEKTLMTDVTKLRNMNMTSNEGKVKADEHMSTMFGKFLAVSENYPNLKANESINQLMEQATYLEQEIAASRRLYNREVNRFNTKLFTWPTNVAASGMKLTTLPLFSASETDKQDVSLKNLGA